MFSVILQGVTPEVCIPPPLRLWNSILFPTLTIKCAQVQLSYLTKAFDLVYNYLLLDQSFAVGLSNMSLLWFNSYFHYRCQGLLFRVSLFNFTAINEDIPQGSTLGPIVFSISIDDLPNCCSKFNVHLYADDAIIYCSKPSITEINISLQQDFDSIQCWMNS